MENKNSIEMLENDYWGEVPNNVSYVVRNSYVLRKKNIQDLEIEDIRFLLGQNIGVQYILPTAIRILENEILAEGDYYPGDLLMNMLTLNNKYWDVDSKLKAKFKKLLNKNFEKIKIADVSKEIKKDLEEAINNFLNS